MNDNFDDDSVVGGRSATARPLASAVTAAGPLHGDPLLLLEEAMQDIAAALRRVGAATRELREARRQSPAGLPPAGLPGVAS